MMVFASRRSSSTAAKQPFAGHRCPFGTARCHDMRRARRPRLPPSLNATTPRRVLRCSEEAMPAAFTAASATRQRGVIAAEDARERDIVRHAAAHRPAFATRHMMLLLRYTPFARTPSPRLLRSAGDAATCRAAAECPPPPAQRYAIPEMSFWRAATPNIFPPPAEGRCPRQRVPVHAAAMVVQIRARCRVCCHSPTAAADTLPLPTRYFACPPPRRPPLPPERRRAASRRPQSAYAFRVSQMPFDASAPFRDTRSSATTPPLRPLPHVRALQSGRRSSDATIVFHAERRGDAGAAPPRDKVCAARVPCEVLPPDKKTRWHGVAYAADGAAVAAPASQQRLPAPCDVTIASKPSAAASVEH